MIEMNVEEVFISDTTDQTMIIEIVEKGLSIKIQNDGTEDDIPITNGDFEFILNKPNLRALKKLIKNIKENPDNEFIEKMRIYSDKGINILRIQNSIIDDVIDFDIENTQCYCTIEIGKELDLFEQYVLSALKHMKK